MARRLHLVMKSGKCVLGYKQTLRALRLKKGMYVCLGLLKLVAAKLVIVSANCPPLRRAEVEYYSILAKTGVHFYGGNNIELGITCGKFHRVSCMAVTEPGDSDIIRSI